LNPKGLLQPSQWRGELFELDQSFAPRRQQFRSQRLCGFENGDRSSGVDVSFDNNARVVPACAWNVGCALE
jgi:hypothetical protein